MMKLAFTYKPRPPRLRNVLIALAVVLGVPALALVAFFLGIGVMQPGSDDGATAEAVAQSVQSLATKPTQQVRSDAYAHHAQIIVMGFVTPAEQDEALRVARQTLSTLTYTGQVTVYFRDSRLVPNEYGQGEHLQRGPLLRKVDLQKRISSLAGAEVRNWPAKAPLKA